MVHTPSCETAVGHGCSCSCLGVGHGQHTTAYVIGTKGIDPNVQSALTASQKKIATSSSKILQEGFKTQGLLNSASCVLLFDVLKPILGNSGSTAVFAQVVANLSNKKIEIELKNLVQRSNNSNADDLHMLCEIAAAVVSVSQDIQNGVLKLTGKVSQQWDQLIDAIIDAVIAARANRRGNPCKSQNPKKTTVGSDPKTSISQNILKASVKKLTRALLKNLMNSMPAMQLLQQLEKSFQILAIILCPWPQAHKIVWNLCVVPLSTDAIKQQIIGSISTNPTAVLLTDLDTWD